MLEFLEVLKTGRNLLAFSAGVDSSALYFLLQESGIAFDVAIVDYGLRKQSKLEVSRAKTLCFWDHKKCFVKQAEYIATNFESNARKVRYAFFEEVMREENYENLIVAHQLNDAFEWFLMQFCKGSSLLKMEGCYKKQGAIDYMVVRPLIRHSRAGIVAYLQEKKIFYFEDFSNLDSKYLRNVFRKNFSDPLLLEFEDGISFSLEHLQLPPIAVQCFRVPSLRAFCVFADGNLLEIDRACKYCGIVLSRAQRDLLQKALEKDSFSMVLQHKVSVEKQANRMFVAPYLGKCAVIPKEFKEKYRRLKIPKYFRYFLENARKLGKLEEVLLILREL